MHEKTVNLLLAIEMPVLAEIVNREQFLNDPLSSDLCSNAVSSIQATNLQETKTTLQKDYNIAVSDGKDKTTWHDWFHGLTGCDLLHLPMELEQESEDDG